MGSAVLLGPFAGRFNGGVVSIPTVAPGKEAWVQVRVLDVAAAGFDDATARGLRHGASNVGRVTTGGWINPPTVPAYLKGLLPFRLEVPEPSTLWVVGLGWAVLMGGRAR